MNEERVCLICCEFNIDTFKGDVNMICDHSEFHEECLITWGKYSFICPFADYHLQLRGKKFPILMSHGG